MRVLVTRPQPGAARTAARLVSAGHEPVLLPLTATVPLPVEPEALAGPFEAVAVTSANAIRHLDAAARDRLAALPLLAVGAATAGMAQAAGLRDVREGSGDAAGLAKLAVGTLREGSAVLYLCGRVRRETFEADLVSAGLRVVAVEVYDTVATDPDPAAVSAALGPRPIDAMLFHSAACAAALGPLLPSLVHRLGPACVAACLSSRIAEALPRNLEAGIRVAARPDDASLLASLEKPHPGGDPANPFFASSL